MIGIWEGIEIGFGRIVRGVLIAGVEKAAGRESSDEFEKLVTSPRRQWPV